MVSAITARAVMVTGAVVTTPFAGSSEIHAGCSVTDHVAFAPNGAVMSLTLLTLSVLVSCKVSGSSASRSDPDVTGASLRTQPVTTNASANVSRLERASKRCTDCQCVLRDRGPGEQRDLPTLDRRRHSVSHEEIDG